VLPGSRAGEVARLAEPLCRAAARLLAEGRIRSATLVCAPGLDARAAETARASAARAGLSVTAAPVERGAATLLSGFELALCASGTASLEAALAGAAPVIAYRLDPLGYAVARRLVRVPHIALPNILLGRRVYPELIQHEVTPERIAAAAGALLDRPEVLSAARRELFEILALPSAKPFGERVADLFSSWKLSQTP